MRMRETFADRMRKRHGTFPWGPVLANQMRAYSKVTPYPAYLLPS